MKQTNQKELYEKPQLLDVAPVTINTFVAYESTPDAPTDPTDTNDI